MLFILKEEEVVSLICGVVVIVCVMWIFFSLVTCVNILRCGFRLW